jgi:hypothetical protein
LLIRRLLPTLYRTTHPTLWTSLSNFRFLCSNTKKYSWNIKTAKFNFYKFQEIRREEKDTNDTNGYKDKRIQTIEIVPHDNHHANRRNPNTLNTNEKCFSLHSSADSAVSFVISSSFTFSKAKSVTNLSVHSPNTSYGFWAFCITLRKKTLFRRV